MDVADQLRDRIAREGPISVADYMGLANAAYYAARDPLGTEGDFTTAPEISQMFGELIGLWLADLWLRAGKPAQARYVELGPGRGTLAADALRAMRSAGLHPPVDLVETSPALRAAQRGTLPAARWHDGVETLPEGAPLLVVANEFFDALPVRQIVFEGHAWRELLVEQAEAGFRRVAGPPVQPPSWAPAAPAEGSIVEERPAARQVMQAIGERLATAGGAALIVDYGHDRHSVGDTLQAVSAHAYADPWQRPGERDLTAHVDFDDLCGAAREEGLRPLGPVGQGAWLRAMGIDLRAASLAKAAPERTEEVVAARERLTAPEQMGRLFRVLAIVAPRWPAPEGF
jgi:NADH dehydrogenase [ubiquinone] 1 alpha subcomplex assembly factor 7